MKKVNGQARHLLETLGFYPFVLVPSFFFCSLFLMAITIKHIIGILLFGLLSTFFLIGSIAKIKISENELIIERILLGTSYWNFDEIRFRAGGRILAYGGIYGGWIIPLKWLECVKIISASESKQFSAHSKDSNKILPFAYLLVVPMVLFALGKIAGYFKFTISPLIWALLWAAGITLAIVAYLSTAPIRIEIGKFNKKQTSMVIGLIVGLITFFSVLLIYSS